MHIEFVLLSIAAIANILLGALVLYRTYKNLYSWFFAITLLFVAVWAIGDILLLSSGDPSTTAISTRLFYAGPMVIPITILLFGLTFPAKKLKPGKLLGALGVLVVGMVPILIDPEVVSKAARVATDGLYVPQPQMPNFLIYASYFSLTFLAVYVALFFEYRREQNVLARVQLKYTFFGVMIASIPALITNLSLPMAGYGRLIWLGPLFTTAFVVSIGISIVQHKMFDIRWVVARSLGYVFALTAVASIYGFVVFGFARVGLRLHFSLTAQIYLSVATSIVALSFARVKRTFDHLSNRLFYRDAYDVQDLYDRLNRILVSTLDTTKLLRDISRLLGDSFRSEFVVIGLKESAMRDRLIIGALPGQEFDDAVPIVRRLTVKHHQRVIVTDYLDSGESKLKQILEQHDIAVLVRLTPNVANEEEGLGYVAFGRKKSGSPYGTSDSRVLDTIANELIVAIQNALHFEEIQNFNKTLQERVQKATIELRRSNAKLKTLDETKDEFISMASHQLRTPLTSVKGYLSMVLEGDAGKLNANQRKLLEQSFASSQRMVFLISDLLNLSRLNTGKFVIEPSPVDLNEIVQLEVDQLAETAKSRELKLVYDAPKSFPTLLLDETKIHQVVMNFLDNAIYYTQAGGTVTVRLAETPTAVEYTVTDTGIGVPRAVQHKLFSKFYRASNAQQARPDGTGLGLFMAKKVIVAQGGSIIFESEEGKGSTFGFRFSKAKHLPAEALPSDTVHSAALKP